MFHRMRDTRDSLPDSCSQLSQHLKKPAAKSAIIAPPEHSAQGNRRPRPVTLRGHYTVVRDQRLQSLLLSLGFLIYDDSVFPGMKHEIRPTISFMGMLKKKVN